MATSGQIGGSTSLTNLNVGIIGMSRTTPQLRASLQLPEVVTTPNPSDSKVEEILRKFWKADSLETNLHDNLKPSTTSLETLTPQGYQTAINNAVNSFKDLPPGLKKTQSEAIKNVIADLEQNNQNSELLYLLRQVVHLA